MKTFLISYDLGKPETSAGYRSLIKYIDSFPAWAKALHSVWLVKSDKDIKIIRDEITALIDENDRILVMEITHSSCTTYNLSKRVTDWMKDNL